MLVQSSVWWDSCPASTENVNTFLKNNLLITEPPLWHSKQFFFHLSIFPCILFVLHHLFNSDTCTIKQGICYSPLEHFLLQIPFIPSPHPECEITTSQPNLCLWPGNWPRLHWDTLTCHPAHTTLQHPFIIFNSLWILQPSVSSHVCLYIFLPHPSFAPSIRLKWREQERWMESRYAPRKENNSMWRNHLACQTELSSQYTRVGVFQKHYLPSKSLMKTFIY